jgi:hypothetical protein
MMTESDTSPASARLRLARHDRSMQTTGSWWWSHRVSEVLKLQGAWACVLEGTRDLTGALNDAWEEV